MRVIDCVGYMVDGALGDKENGEKRMVTTPWNKDPIPFEEAAEIGTEKVIGEHSTIGVLMTCDGSVADIPRENYVPAEEKAAARLQEIGNRSLSRSTVKIRKAKNSENSAPNWKKNTA